MSTSTRRTYQKKDSESNDAKRKACEMGEEHTEEDKTIEECPIERGNRVMHASVTPGVLLYMSWV
jgi:hypothetical protein